MPLFFNLLIFGNLSGYNLIDWGVLESLSGYNPTNC